MNSNQTHEQSLLQAALALESAVDREAFLNAACANNPCALERFQSWVWPTFSPYKALGRPEKLGRG
jgi:hypothetical protein